MLKAKNLTYDDGSSTLITSYGLFDLFSRNRDGRFGSRHYCNTRRELSTIREKGK